MNAVVTVKSIKVFGDSKEYPADEVTMKKFVKWAMETKADLRAHPMLNEQLRVLDQCITTEAMTVLWHMWKKLGPSTLLPIVSAGCMDPKSNQPYQQRR